MAISLSTVQSTWGGSNPISLNEYYVGGNYIGPNNRGGSIPSSGAISLNNFNGALNQYNWGRTQYINGDQSNDGCGYSMDYYYQPTAGKYCLVFNFGAMSASFGLDATQLTYATSSSNMNTWQVVYSLPMTTVGTTVTSGSGNNIKGGESWAGNFSGGWIVKATLNSNNTVTLQYNSSGSSGDAGTNYALARQRDAWIAMFGSYTATFSVPKS